jgi:hypothetical protein
MAANLTLENEVRAPRYSLCSFRALAMAAIYGVHILRGRSELCERVVFTDPWLVPKQLARLQLLLPLQRDPAFQNGTKLSRSVRADFDRTTGVGLESSDLQESCKILWTTCKRSIVTSA